MKCGALPSGEILSNSSRLITGFLKMLPAFERGGNPFVFESGRILARQAEQYACDDVAAFVLSLLEHRVAVPVSAFLNAELDTFACLHIKADDTRADIFYFSSVGSDVLYCGGSDLARYERKIFSSPQSVAACLPDEVVKIDPGADHYRNFIKTQVHIFDKFYVGMQHCAGEIASKQQVAAFSDVHYGLWKIFQDEAFKFLYVLIFDEASAGHLHPESVLRTEIVFELYPHEDPIL